MNYKNLPFIIFCILSYNSQADTLISNDPSYANIHIISATYGKECGGRTNNATVFYKKICEGKIYCNYTPFSIKNLKSGCAKVLDIKWRCGINKRLFETSFSEDKLSKGNKLMLMTCGIN